MAKIETISEKNISKSGEVHFKVKWVGKDHFEWIPFLSLKDNLEAVTKFEYYAAEHKIHPSRRDVCDLHVASDDGGDSQLETPEVTGMTLDSHKMITLIASLSFKSPVEIVKAIVDNQNLIPICNSDQLYLHWNVGKGALQVVNERNECVCESVCGYANCQRDDHSLCMDEIKAAAEQSPLPGRPQRESNTSAKQNTYVETLAFAINNPLDQVNWDKREDEYDGFVWYYAVHNKTSRRIHDFQTESSYPCCKNFLVCEHRAFMTINGESWCDACSASRAGVTPRLSSSEKHHYMTASVYRAASCVKELKHKPLTDKKNWQLFIDHVKEMGEEGVLTNFKNGVSCKMRIGDDESLLFKFKGEEDIIRCCQQPICLTPLLVDDRHCKTHQV